MLERERTLYDFVLHYGRLLTADLDDARLADVPAPGMNPPAWVLGHLAIATDYAAGLLGEPRACPRAWHVLFGPGSTVRPDRAAYPGKQELFAALEAGHARVAAAAARATDAQLAAPQPGPILQDLLPTVGDLLGHLMTTHPAAHLGQLSAWRRLNGLPAVLKF